jgi:hypothetical protein
MLICSSSFAETIDELISVKQVKKDRTLIDVGQDLDIQAHLRIVPDKSQVLAKAARLMSKESIELAENFASNLATIRELIIQSNELAVLFVKLDLSLDKSKLQKNPDYNNYIGIKKHFFDNLLKLASKELYPGFEEEISAVLGKSESSSENPDPEGEFYSFAKILTTTLDSLSDNFQQQLDGVVSLEIKAYHYTQTNNRVLIGPRPYVEIEQCAATPLKRFEMLPSESAQQEIEFARQLAPVANDIMSGKFKEQVSVQINELRARARELEHSLKTDLLDKIVKDIKKIDVLNTTKRLAVDKLVGSVEQLNQKLKTLKASLRATDTSQISQLSNFATSIDYIPGEVGLIIEGMSGQVRVIKANLKYLAQDTIGNVKSDIEEFLENLNQQVIGEGILTDYFKNVQKIGKTYVAMTEIRDAAANINAKVNQVPVSNLVEGSLVLDELCQLRQSGDKISIQARLFNKDGEVIANPPDRTYKLRDLNWHISTRGFLAFAHPEDSPNVTTQQEYQAVPAIAWYFKKDKPNNDTYNDLWSPGYGFTAMAMNFNDTDSFELGLGVSVTFLNDLLHVSYGWNVQTQSEFYSIGINPLVFQKLFSK